MDTLLTKYESTVEVEQFVSNACEALMEEDTAVRGCYRILHRNLFGRGLYAVSGGPKTEEEDQPKASSSSSSPQRKRRKQSKAGERSSSQSTSHFGEYAPPAADAVDSKLDPGFQQYITTYYNEFLETAFYHLICFGYFVWIERTTEAFDHDGVRREVKYPEVVQNGLYRIKIRRNADYTFDWLIYPSQNVGFTVAGGPGMSLGDPDPRLKIYLLADNHPLETTGRYRSTIHILLRDAVRMREMMAARLNADKLRGFPPVFIEHEEHRQESKLGGLVENMFANPAMMDAIDPRAGADARRKAQEEFEQAQQHEQNFAEGGAMRLQTMSFTGGMEGAAVRQNYRDNIVVIPRGLRVASQPAPPQVSTDILEMELRRLEDVNFTMGVPGTFSAAGQAKGGGQGATKADAADFRILSRTIKFWQGKLIAAVTDVFHTIHPPEEGGFVHFRLPVVPYVEQLTMFQLVDQDFVKMESAKRYMAHAHGLEDDDVLDKGQKNRHDRPTIWGTERATESFIKGDAEVKKSEAGLNEALEGKAKADAKAALMPKPASASS